MHDFSRTNWFILVTGLAVVNGAQTTGAIGSLSMNAKGRVLARFIKCEDATTVQDIIRYNNRQNPTEASDFRSNDRVQTRLVQEFRQLRIVGYNGGRRGGADDVIRPPGENQLAASTAAQALAAFHGRPDVAYHEKGQIWEVDAIYSDVFPDRISARHILFVYTLLRTIEDEKFRLNGKPPAERTRDDRELLDWLALRGSTFLAVAAIGASMETVLGVAIPDRYALSLRGTPGVAAAIDLWRPIVTSTLALAPGQLSDALAGKGGLRNRPAVGDAITRFRAIVVSTKRVNAPVYSAFAAKVTK